MPAPVEWPTRPVFISSTFKDMQAERDWLRRVFLDLEEELKKRHHHLETIDLRLGVETIAGDRSSAGPALFRSPEGTPNQVESPPSGGPLRSEFPVSRNACLGLKHRVQRVQAVRPWRRKAACREGVKEASTGRLH